MRRFAVIVVLALFAGAALRALRRRRQLPAPPRTSPQQEPADAPAPTGGEPRFVSVAWTLAAPPNDRPELAVRCRQDDQLVLDRVDVQETPTQVFLTAIARQQPRTGEEPPRTDAEATVALSRPLGTRELIATPVDAGPDAAALYP